MQIVFLRGIENAEPDIAGPDNAGPDNDGSDNAGPGIDEPPLLC